MGRLTETDKCGNWGLKEIPWENLLVGTPITWDTYAALYGALFKLKDYEDTGLSPDEVVEINDFEKSQVSCLLKQLNEEQRNHCWIPVEERLPNKNATRSKRKMPTKSQLIAPIITRVSAVLSNHFM